MDFHAVKCRYLVISAASYYIRVVFKHGIISQQARATYESLCSNLCWKIQHAA